MVADAMCLWTATALPTLGPAAIPAESTSGSPRGARCLDRPVPDHKGPCGRLLSHRCHRMLLLNRTGSPVRRSARATRCGRHLPSSEAQQHLRSLSLIYLSLSGAQPPAQGGWGAVHHSKGRRGSRMGSRYRSTTLKGLSSADAGTTGRAFDRPPRRPTGRNPVLT